MYPRGTCYFLTNSRLRFGQNDFLARYADDGGTIAAVLRAVRIIFSDAVLSGVFANAPVFVRQRAAFFPATFVFADAATTNFIQVDQLGIISVIAVPGNEIKL